MIGKLRKICIVANIFLEIIILGFMQQWFPCFEVKRLLCPSVALSASAFLSFCHLASRIKALKRSSASPVTLAIIPIYKFYPGFSLRHMAQACLCSMFF